MKNKAKHLSWLSKILVIGFCMFSFFFFPSRSGTEIIQVGGFILLSFTAVDVSIILEVFFNHKNQSK